MEVEKGTKDNGDSHEVVVSIPGTEENSVNSKTSEASSRGIADYMQFKPPDVDVKRQELLSSNIQMTSNPSPGISNLSPSPNRPPKPPSESSFRRRTISNSAYSKSKSRLVEPQTTPKKPVLDSDQVYSSFPPPRSSPNMLSPSSRAATPKESGRKTSGHVTPRTPLMASKEEDDDDEDDTEVYTPRNLHGSEKKKGKKVKVMILIEWFLFLGILALLITSLTLKKLNDVKIWKVQIWRWSVLALVIFCGRLVTEWFTNLLSFLIERNFILKRNVVYFLYGLRNSVRVFIWLGFILLTYELLINRAVERSNDTERALNKITRGISCTLGGAALWMVKTFLIKLLASTFHVKTFFDRIQESIFHQYVLQTLSGPPLIGYEIGNSRTSGQLSFSSTITTKKGKEKDVVDELINVDKLYRTKKEKVSAWTMSGLVDVIRSRGLSTLVGTLDEIEDEGVQQQIEISNEMEAKACARRIFKNVAKPGKKHIEEDDLLRFMTREEVDNAFPLFQGAIETGQIKKSSFKIWVTYAYNERKCLAHSLNDSKTAIEELNRISSVAVLIIIGIMWLLLMDITSTKVLVYISSQLLVLVFMFGNTFKTLFEGIIFNFIVHPFDVGDRCVIDGVEMVVEEMNLLTTIFLRHDNEKIYYPNSVLSTMAISNFNRSPEMADSVEFAVDFSTSVESIAALKEKIKAYLESKPQHWRPNFKVQLKEIEDINKMKMILTVTHTMNFQNSLERNNRKSDLVFQLKKLFGELEIKYSLPPQELLISYVDTPTSSNLIH